MYVGLDIGTSGVKAVLTNAHGHVLRQSTAPLALANPHPLWSEQAPEDWWRAASEALADLKRTCDLGSVRSVGLSGQMHGAVLLDQSDRVLRLQSCGMMVVRTRNARSSKRSSPARARSPAIWRCQASLRPRCSGCAGTSQHASRPFVAYSCRKIGCDCV